MWGGEAYAKHIFRFWHHTRIPQSKHYYLYNCLNSTLHEEVVDHSLHVTS